MKTLLTLASLLSLSGLTFAGPQCKEKVCDKSASATTECATKCADKSDCDTACDKSITAKTEFVVTGMTCGGCSDKLTSKLAKVEGISNVSVCHKSGHAKMVIDSTKSSKAAVITAIKENGYKVPGERIYVSINSSSCAGCPTKLNEKLTSTKGIVAVETVCQASGKAIVVIDPAQTDAAAVAAVANPAPKKS